MTQLRETLVRWIYVSVTQRFIQRQSERIGSVSCCYRLENVSLVSCQVQIDLEKVLQLPCLATWGQQE